MATVELVGRASAGAESAWDEPLYEIVNGQEVETTPMGALQNALASYLCGQLNQVGVPRKHGLAVTETLFVLRRDPELHRRSDVAYVSYARWPERSVTESNAWDVIPNLAVEVVSRTNTADEVETKRTEYVEAGVELIWIIYPTTETIHVCAGPRRIDVLSADDELDGGTVVPGFRMKVADLFKAVQAPE